MESKIKKLKRITPPKYKIGRLVLNEYELRQLLLDVLIGEIERGFQFYSILDNTFHEVDLMGNVNVSPKSFAISSDITMKVIKYRRSQYNIL